MTPHTLALLGALLLPLAAAAQPNAQTDAQPDHPNVVLVFIDDLGYGDLGVTGATHGCTPRLDAFAAQSTRFTQFYAASPICSPSRVGLLTGQYPARWRIHSFLNTHADNQRRGMPDWLDPDAPLMPRAFQAAGYATAHFGKWHLGGGRDVGDAPLPTAYGLDESHVAFEGLGDRTLIHNHPLSDRSAELGRGTIAWADKHELTALYIDHSIDFVTRARDANQPFYLQLFPGDVHDAFRPSDTQLAPYADATDNPTENRFRAVLRNLDEQLGRFLDALDTLGLADHTIVLVTGDNGPTAWPHYYNQGIDPPGSTAGLRGRKWSLYEGGTREPLLVRWPNRVPAGHLDPLTVTAAIDILPTLCALAGVTPPDADLDGIDLSRAWLGEPILRDTPLFWEYPRAGQGLRPGLASDQSPPLAVRLGQWKLLMSPDGSNAELYDLATDPYETTNRAAGHPARVADLQALLNTWHASLPE